MEYLDRWSRIERDIAKDGIFFRFHDSVYRVMRLTMENEPFSFENYIYKCTFTKTRNERDEINEEHNIQLCNTNRNVVIIAILTVETFESKIRREGVKACIISDFVVATT